MAIADTDIFTVEADYYDGASVQTLRVCSSGPVPLTTGVSDTPASTTFSTGFGEFTMQSRNAFGDRQTAGSANVADGDVILLNPNGFNAPFDQYRSRPFDGRMLTVRRGQLAGAYPSSYRTLMRAPMHAAVWDHDRLVLRVRDTRKLTSVALQTVQYAGTNVAGVGLEGTPSDLKGKNKPVALGRSFNVSPPLVNAQKQIYQIADNSATVSDVRDGGVSLGVGSGSAATWTSRTTPYTVNDILYAVAYGNSLYVAGGASATSAGLIATSPDGITWTARTLPGTPHTVSGLAFGAGLWVSVGGLNTTAGEIHTSPDGITWTARTSSFGTSAVSCVIYSASVGLFVAGGFSGKIATSPDGITWTQRTNPFAGTDTISSVAFGAGLFVATGGTGTIASSPDGITWTLRTVAFSNAKYNSVAYSSVIKLFVLGGYDATTLIGGVGTSATSEDGITWIRRDGFLGAELIQSITTSGTVFAAVGSNAVLGTSLDGITWTIQTGALGTDLKNAIVYGNANFVAVGTRATIVQSITGDYSTLADLQDDTLQPAQGSYRVFSSSTGSWFRLGSPPAGAVTCDPVQGANAAARTGGQIMVQAFARAGVAPTTGYSTADITALDAANAAEMGMWFGPDDSAAVCADVIDAAARSLGAFWAGDSLGVIRVKRLTDPSGGSSVATFTENDLQDTLVPLESGDSNEGIIPYQHRIQYAKNYTVQTSGLFGVVTAANRALYGLEWREAKATDATVLASHPLSQPSVIDTIYAFEADAQTEATRLQALKGVEHEWYQVPLKLTDAALDIELGDVITITNGRFGLGLGVKAVVLGIAPDFKDSPAAVTTLTCWTNANDASFAMYFAADGADVVLSSVTEAYAFTDSGGGDYTLTAGPFSSGTVRLNMALKAGDITLS